MSDGLLVVALRGIRVRQVAQAIRHACLVADFAQNTERFLVHLQRTAAVTQAEIHPGDIMQVDGDIPLVVETPMDFECR